MADEAERGWEEGEAWELLLIEEADAWFEYLEATRGQTRARYGELEPWAWSRLAAAAGDPGAAGAAPPGRGLTGVAGDR